MGNGPETIPELSLQSLENEFKVDEGRVAGGGDGWSGLSHTIIYFSKMQNKWLVSWKHKNKTLVLVPDDNKI